MRFSTLQRVEIAEIEALVIHCRFSIAVSVLFNESKLLKLYSTCTGFGSSACVSVLFNESKLLKLR